MTKHKIYQTKDGQKVMVAFYRANVAWKIAGKEFSQGIDSIETFFRRMASQGWKEIVA